MKSKRNACRSSRAFTLIEVLVVCSIISSLMALVLSALASAREQARQTVCSSNLHQIGLAFHMYTSDYDDAPPLRFQELADAYIKNKQVLICPNDITKNWGGIDDIARGVITKPPDTISYSYLHPFNKGTGYRSTWLNLLKTDNPGVAVCQLHGSTNSKGTLSMLSYEGLVLRLQLDGSVIRKHVQWIHNPDGSDEADPWKLFTEAPYNPTP